MHAFPRTKSKRNKNAARGFNCERSESKTKRRPQRKEVENQIFDHAHNIHVSMKRRDSPQEEQKRTTSTTEQFNRHKLEEKETYAHRRIETELYR